MYEDESGPRGAENTASAQNTAHTHSNPADDWTEPQPDSAALRAIAERRRERQLRQVQDDLAGFRRLIEDDLALQRESADSRFAHVYRQDQLATRVTLVELLPIARVLLYVAAQLRLLPKGPGL